jgi:CO/xanthine dehydrogenase FAD-binding subunit
MVEAYRPETLNDALDILSKESCTILAGGTDLMVQRSRGSSVLPSFEKPVIFISHLKELQRLSKEDDGIHIGAGAILSDIMRSDIVPEVFKEMIGKMASPPTRNMASIGGNICNASPAGDTLPYLYAMNADVVLKRLKGERKISISDFISGPKKTVLESNEIMTEIIIPEKEFQINSYTRLGQRKGMSLTKVSFLGMADIENNKIIDIRIALGSVAPKIVRSKDIEQDIIGKNINDINSKCKDMAARYMPLITPIDDARSSAAYRKKVCMRLINNFLENLK